MSKKSPKASANSNTPTPPARRAPGAVIAAGVGVLALSAAGVWLWQRPPRSC
jgi:hypothetical protein